MHQINKQFAAGSGDNSIFTVSSLSFTYPHGPQALRGVDLQVACGDRLAIVGPNGSGKSTLVKHFNGLLSAPPTSLFYKGEELRAERLQRARFEVGLLFQDPDDHLFCNTIFDDVAFGPMNQGLTRQQVEAIVQEKLQQVGLWGLRTKAAHCLSSGQKKRAAMAAILALEPETLILDEPTANLDTKQLGVIVDILNNFCGTLICISHDLFFLEEICSRALVLDRGKVHHDFSMAELMAAPDALRGHGLDYSFRYGGGDSGEGIDVDASGVGSPADVEMCGVSRGEPIIELSDYSLSYPDGSMGIDGLNLQIGRGENIALVGENGAGKSTLAACLTGILVGQGTYMFAGAIVGEQQRRELWRRVGIIFQDSADQLFCPTCWDEVAFGLKQRRLANDIISKKVKAALTMVHLDGYESRVPIDLSGGERKRLAIASVVCLQPQVLIMDEPTAGLDPQGEKMLFDIISQLDMTTIIITHDMFFVRRHCQRALVLQHGKLICDCNIEEFFRDIHVVAQSRMNYNRQICGDSPGMATIGD